MTTPEGIRIEVKSAAYLQSWTQKQLSKIIFSINPTRAWDSSSGEFAEEPRRSADVYVFCLLKHQDKDTLDPLDLGQWEFYVISATELNNYTRSTTTITLSSLQKLTPGIAFHTLHDTIIAQAS